jgi:hypothetical protein
MRGYVCLVSARHVVELHELSAEEGAGDIFEGRPINPRAVTGPVYAPGEHAAFQRHWRDRLGEREARAQPTAKDIDVLLAFLPGFVHRSSPFAEWKRVGESSDSVVTLPYPSYAPDVSVFFDLAAQECWSDQGYRPDVAGAMLEDDASIDHATLAEIRTMLTYCVRGEQFCDGHREGVLRSGRLVALLTRLQVLRREM